MNWEADYELWVSKALACYGYITAFNFVQVK